MSDRVYIEGPNGLVIGHSPSVAAGLLKHADHKKVPAPVFAEPEADQDPGDTPAPAPAGNASTEDWHAYALASGKTSADLDGLGQREIRALFTEA
jgi:hypothetical protein